MKQRLTKHLSKKRTIEDIFKGIGYFAATSALVQLCLPIIRGKDLLTKFGFMRIVFGLLVLSGYYLAVHVIRPIVKVYHPSFTLPHADRSHIEGSRFRDNLKRPGNLLFTFLILLTVYLGWSLVEMALQASMKHAV